MRILVALGVAGIVGLAAVSADAQVRIETTRPQQPPAPEARVVPPPLHYEQTRPRDADFYPYGTRVEHDPAFIEPFAGSYQTATGSGRFGLSGWTAPNPPVGSEATLWRQTSGWFALGFSVTWDGPAARPAPSARPSP
ncbi:MAG TPA: hypothetical protein VF010_15525 [Methylomirabilota bacterium]|jgi:hypothetical protein|nr:hypothetical protein [Methylomirabilota bacterium]